MIRSLIEKLSTGKDLTFEEVDLVIDIFEKNTATNAQMGAFLTALKIKGETSEEVTAFALAVRKRSLKIDLSDLDNVVDSCGTGGDCINTFNISTAASILATSGGAIVAKHSNSGFTSNCGSSNVLESLGINLVKTPQEAKEAVKKCGITFIHAPYFHKCTASVSPARKELGIRTIFNFLGPLTNPANPTGQLLGVSNPNFLGKMAETLKNIGVKRALVVCGQDPLIDEISILGITIVYRLNNGNIDNFIFSPEDFGIKRAKVEDIKGGDAIQNASIIKNIFSGNLGGAKLDAVALNAAGMLWCANKSDRFEDCINMAYQLLAQGKAKEKLEEITKGHSTKSSEILKL